MPIIVKEEHVLPLKNAMSQMRFDPRTSPIVNHRSTTELNENIVSHQSNGDLQTGKYLSLWQIFDVSAHQHKK
jgi:hypothetical protein